MKKNLLRSLLFAATMAAATGAWAQEDVTSQYLQNADLSVDPNTADNGWVLLNGWRQDYQKATDTDHVNVIEFYSGWNGLEHTEYAMTQTVSLPAGDYRIAVNAFYREGDWPGTGNNNDMAWIFAGEKTQNVYSLNGNLNSYSGTSDLWKASNAFTKGNFSNEFDFTLEEDAEIELGFKGTFDQKRSWIILGPVKLYKYSLEAYLVDYREKVAVANELLAGHPMYYEVREELNAAIVDESTFTLSKEVTAAIQTLNTAIAKAQASVAAYERLFAVLDKGIAFIEKAVEYGAPTANETALDDIYGNYEEGLIADADIDTKISEINVILIGIAKQQTKPGADMTLAIQNPSFETGNTEGWTFEPSNDTGAKENSNATYTMSGCDGNYLFNIWQSGNAISQTVEGLPNGLYKLQAVIATDADRYVQLNANDQYVQIASSEEGKGVGVEGEVEFNVTDGTATIGAEGGMLYDEEGMETGKTWYKVDNFRLILHSSDIYTKKTIYANLLAEAETLRQGKPMYSEVRDALNTAIEADVESMNDEALVDEAITNLSNAINAAKASIAAYEKLGALIESGMQFIAQAIENGAPTEYETALDDYYMNYEEGAYPDADIPAKMAEINAILANVAKQQTAVGSDMTRLLTNPDFEQNDTQAVGWTIEVPEYGTGNAIVGGNSFNHCFEAYNNPGFNVYQVVEDVPFGVYEIEVQGFYRYLRDDNAWNAYQAQEVDYVKRAGVPVYIYMNDNATPFTNIFDVDPIPYGELYSTDASLLNPANVPPYVEPSGEYWYPNEMYNSALAFMQGMYKQSAWGLVAFEGDKLQLGVKGKSNQGGDSWVIWDNFKLIYRGFAPEVIKPVLEDAMADVEELQGLLMGKTPYGNLALALEDAAKAIADNDGEAMFKALRDIYAAKEPARDSKDLFLEKDVKADTTRLAEAIREVEVKKLSQATLQAANDLLTGIQENALYENEEIEQLKQDVTDIIDRLNNSVDLYARLVNALDNLLYAIDEAKGYDYIDMDIVNRATNFHADATDKYDAGSYADSEVPDVIDEINNLINELFKAIDTAVGIRSTEVATEAEPVYNLGGQRVGSQRSGLYIKGQRKVVVK